MPPRAAGMTVLLFDRDRRGADTLSTLAMMRAGVLAAAPLGFARADARGGGPAIRSTSFVYGDEVITVPIKARDGIDALYSPRRTLLRPAAGGCRIGVRGRTCDSDRDSPTSSRPSSGRVIGVGPRGP